MYMHFVNAHKKLQRVAWAIYSVSISLFNIERNEVKATQ